MPIARFEMPDGRIGRFEVPEGTTPEQAQTLISESLAEQPEVSPVETQETPEEKGYIQSRVEAVKGFGESLVNPETYKNIGKELTSFPPVTEETKSQLREKAMDIGIAALPVTQVGRTFRNTLRPENFVKPGVKVAAEAGYFIPRSNVKETLATNLGERFGGKQAIEATAQIKNQPITNKLAAKALGLADDTPITVEVLKDLRSEAGKAYEAASQVGTLTADKTYRESLREIVNKFSGASKDFPELGNREVGKLVRGLNKPTMSAEGVVEQIKNLREAGQSNLSMGAKAAEKLLGKAQLRASKVLEDLLERNIEPSLGKDMLNNYRQARTLIAKTYSVERALNPSTGNIVATELAKQAKKGSKLSGELRQIANFARAFPRLSREPIGAPASGGLFEPLVYGGVGGGVAGPGGMAAAAIPIVAKPLARKAMVTVPKIGEESTKKLLDEALVQRTILGGGLQLKDQP